MKKRVWEHRNNVVEGFTKTYEVHMLVYYEIYQDPAEAILREKRIKRWKRAWKIQLIEKDNSTWEDLYDEI